MFLIHRRAFWKLGWRIEEFLKRLGKSPFLTVQDAIQPANVNPSPEYSIIFTLAELKILKLSRFLFFEELPEKGVTQVVRKLQVNPQNIQKWLHGFVKHFDILQEQFPPPTHMPGPIPMHEQVVIGVLYIWCLMKLKSVMKYILQIQGVESALICSGTL